MKCYLLALAALFAAINMALAAVGDVAVSDESSNLEPSHSQMGYYQPGQTSPAPPGTASNPNIAVSTFPARAPIPPDPNSENLVMPDYNLYTPVMNPSAQSIYKEDPIDLTSPVQNRLVQAGYPGELNLAVAPQGSYPAMANVPAEASSFTGTCTTCSGSAPVRGGVSSSCPYGSNYPACSAPGSLSEPRGYAPQSYKAVYPVPSVCRCNEYCVQTCPGVLGTVAGVFCGDWLPLWSKINRGPGIYWSFEWTMCQGPQGLYCPPEVRNFGCKGNGWYQTWFKGNNPGWHILSYNCGDWSNYIYIYVWPA